MDTDTDTDTKKRYRYNKDTYEGSKRYYSCNGFDKCPKTLYVLLSKRVYCWFHVKKAIEKVRKDI